jgi:hypothetical protein
MLSTKRWAPLKIMGAHEGSSCHQAMRSAARLKKKGGASMAPIECVEHVLVLLVALAIVAVIVYHRRSVNLKED